MKQATELLSAWNDSLSSFRPGQDLPDGAGLLWEDLGDVVAIHVWRDCYHAEEQADGTFYVLTARDERSFETLEQASEHLAHYAWLDSGGEDGYPDPSHLSPCCGASTTFVEGYLTCKECYGDVGFGIA